MATTDQVRKWYRETVINHDDRGTPGYTPLCNWGIAITLRFPREGGGFFSEPIHPKTVEAWQAYIATMEYYGETMPGTGGVNQCRNIKGTDWPSLHAYLVAVDLPPNGRKSYRFVRAVNRIRTKSGAQVFRTLSNDRMHDQIDCSPADLATGIDWLTVPGKQKKGNNVLGLGDEGNAVSYYQRAYNKWSTKESISVDGIFGPQTEAAVKEYQRAADLTETGRIDDVTAFLLGRYGL